MFNHFTKDTVTICKQNGERTEGIKAGVLPNGIIIEVQRNEDMSAIEAGDIIEHKQTNGIVEQYRVLDPCYCDIPAVTVGKRYQCKVEKLSALNQQRPNVSTTYNVNATQANFASDDATITAKQTLNIEQSNEIEKLFESLLEVVKNNTLENQKAIESAISEMKQAVGKPSFVEKYNAFMQSVANHITIFMPLMPQLTALLQSTPIR